MKKNIIMLFMLMSVLVMSKNVFAAEVSVPGNEFPQEWSITASPAGYADVKPVGEGFILSFDTTSNSNAGRARIQTDCDYSIGAEPFIIELSSTVSNNDDAYKSLSITNSANKSIELVRFKGNKIFPFENEEKAAEYDAGSEQSIIIQVNPENQTGTVWVNGEIIYNGEISDYPIEQDFDVVSFDMRNYSIGRVMSKSDWEIKKLKYRTCGSYSFYSYPTHGARVAAEDIEKISLEYGIEMAPQTYLADNYKLLMNGEPWEFTIERTDSKVNIIPESGFVADASYSLIISELTDILNISHETDKQIDFSVGAYGYKPLEVTALNTEETVFENQTVRLEWKVTNGEAERVEIFSNNSCVSTLTAPPYVYEFSSAQTGEFKLIAKAYDKDNVVSQSRECIVTVIENSLPQISISGLTTGETIELGKDINVMILAKDDQGIANIKIYLDGKLVKTESSDSVNCTISSVGAGKHEMHIVAEDIYGKTTNESIEFIVYGVYYDVYYENDFSDYSGNNTLPTKMQGGAQRGFLDAREIKKEFGKSLIIGIETANTNYTESNSAYVGIPVANSFVLDFDIYISEKPSSKSRYTLEFKQNGSAYQTVTQFTGDKLKIGDVLLDYDAKKWYHMTYRASLGTKKYSVILDGKVIIDNADLTADFAQFNYFRIFGPGDDSIPSYAAVDNVVVKGAFDIPVIEYIRSGGKDDDIVDYDNHSLIVRTSGALEASSVTADKISIYSDTDTALVESVTLADNAIRINLGNDLVSNEVYTIKIDKSVKLDSGSEVGSDITKNFKTSMALFDVVDHSYVSKNGKLVFNVQLKNETGENKKFTLVSLLFDGRTFVGSVAKEITVGADEMLKNISIELGGAQITAQSCFIEDFYPVIKSVTRKIFKTTGDK